MFLGAYVKKITGRTNLHIWAGECHVHAGIRPEDMKDVQAQHPDAEFLIHPECGCASATMLFAQENPEAFRNAQLLSTEGMLNYAKSSPSREFLVATETGIIHRMEKQNPGKRFFPVNRKALCQFMKMITLEKVLRSLREDVFEVRVPEAVAARARLAIERMIAIG
jgi:quinolinate synthase